MKERNYQIVYDYTAKAIQNVTFLRTMPTAQSSISFSEPSETHGLGTGGTYLQQQHQTIRILTTLSYIHTKSPWKL